MGACTSNNPDIFLEGQTGHAGHTPQSKKEEVLEIIQVNFDKIEQTIYKLRNEDVHYRMTKLIFMLNVIREMTPLIVKIENADTSIDNEVYIKLSFKFCELFSYFWKGNKDAFYEELSSITEYISKSIPINNKIIISPN